MENSTDTRPGTEGAATAGAAGATDLSPRLITECVEGLPAWLRDTIHETAGEARMFACLAERLAARCSELEMCLEAALWDHGVDSVDGGYLLLAVEEEVGLSTVEECLMGAVAIITNASRCLPGDNGAASTKALKHAYDHRLDHGEPIVLRSLADFYRRTVGQDA